MARGSAVRRHTGAPGGTAAYEAPGGTAAYGHPAARRHTAAVAAR
ncbi:hypothetical protein [Intrasporangium mesophilum]